MVAFCAIVIAAQKDQPGVSVATVSWWEKGSSMQSVKRVTTGRQESWRKVSPGKEGGEEVDCVRFKREVYFLKPKMPPLLLPEKAGLNLGGMNSLSNVLISSATGCIAGSPVRR